MENLEKKNENQEVTRPVEELASEKRLTPEEGSKKIKKIKEAEANYKELDVTMMNEVDYYLNKNGEIDFGFLQREEVIRAVPAEVLLKLDNIKPGALLYLFTEENVFDPPIQGESIHINFHGNNEAHWLVGAGDLLGPEIQVAKIITDKGQEIIGQRKSRGVNKVGYYDGNGRYLPIFSNYEVYVPTDEEAEGLAVKFQGSEDDFKDILASEKAIKDGFIDDLKEAKLIQKMKFDDYLQQEKVLKEMDSSKKNTEKTIDKVAKELNLSEKDRREVTKIWQAIAKQESSGNHLRLGEVILTPNSGHYLQRPIGKYQFMPLTWKNACKDAFDGQVLYPTEHNQDLVAFREVAKFYQTFNAKKYRGDHLEAVVKMVAVSWYGNNGQPFRDIDDFDGIPAFGGGLSPRQYANDIWTKYNE